MPHSPPCVLLDSINYLRPEHRGEVIVSGSHGGLYCAYKCVAGGVRGAVFNDAGVGKNKAGIASLAFCEPYHLPVAVVDCRSARIGNAGDLLERGVIRRTNAAAIALGASPDMSCREAAALFRNGTPECGHCPPIKEYRHEVFIELPEGKSREAVVCIDSASLITPEDAGRVVITGSHGGLIGGDPAKAINVPARFIAFNDAGFGMEDAGAGRLVPLAERNIAAVLVSCMSACIGEGLSTLEDGIISRVNAIAAAAGFREGDFLKQALFRRIADV